MRAAAGPRFSTRIRRWIVVPGPRWSMIYRRARGLSASADGTSTSRMPKLPGPGPASAWAGLASALVAAASAAATSMSALRNRRTILLRVSGHGMRDRAGVQAGDRRGGDGYGDRPGLRDGARGIGGIGGGD